MPRLINILAGNVQSQIGQRVTDDSITACKRGESPQYIHKSTDRSVGLIKFASCETMLDTGAVQPQKALVFCW